MDVLATDQAAVSPTTGLSAPLTAFPDPTQKPASSAQHAPDETLHKAISQLFGGAKVSVQLKVVEGTHDIVTIFKNADTGEVITQFPPEALVLIGQFFNKLAGAVLDRTA